MKATPEFGWATLDAYVWDLESKNYAPTEGSIPLIPNEYVDVVEVEFDGHQMIFVARQFDTILGVITDKTRINLFDENNPSNIWLEEY